MVPLSFFFPYWIAKDGIRDPYLHFITEGTKISATGGETTGCKTRLVQGESPLQDKSESALLLSYWKFRGVDGNPRWLFAAVPVEKR